MDCLQRHRETRHTHQKDDSARKLNYVQAHLEGGGLATMAPLLLPEHVAALLFVARGARAQVEPRGVGYQLARRREPVAQAAKHQADGKQHGISPRMLADGRVEQ